MLKFDHLVSGVQAGEFTVWSALARAEESIRIKIQLSSMYGTMSQTPAFKKVATEIIDSETWYLVAMRKDVSVWFHEQFADQENTMWRAHIDDQLYMYYNAKEMNEKLYIMLELRWS